MKFEAKKVLIIRFSSFGDIVQALASVKQIKTHSQDSTIHFLTKEMFENFVKLDPGIDKVISLKKKNNLIDLCKLALEIRRGEYDLIYDAHSNMRTSLIKLFLMFSNAIVITRSKDRLKRILLFKFGKNLFEKPFKGMRSYMLPLSELYPQLTTVHTDFRFESSVTNKWSEIISSPYICIAPSAAWAMKTWPLENFKILIGLLRNSLPKIRIVILGGPEDLMCDELALIDSSNIFSMRGKANFVDSAYLISKSIGLVSADTGVIHIADLLKVKGVLLMGPTAFGFTQNQNIKIAQVDLSCRPCTKDGRGNCSQSTYQKCMIDITPQAVLRDILSSFPITNVK